MPLAARDYTTFNENGNRWDFSLENMREKARLEVMDMKPEFIIGSVMCTDWSVMQNVSRKYLTDTEWKARMGNARSHRKFICELYRMQMEGGRYYVHEHPATASSWAEAVVQETMGMPDAWIVRTNMCRFGTTTKKAGHAGLSYKPTDIMTNSVCVADQLDRRCLNMINGMTDHDHEQLEGERPKQAPQYPLELCRAIFRGARD